MRSKVESNMRESAQIAPRVRYTLLLLVVVVSQLLVTVMSVLATESSTTDTAHASQSTTYLAHSAASSDPLSAYALGESVFPSFLKITLALIAVIAGIYLTLALLKKTMGRKISGGGRASAIQVIETCYLAPKRSISLVRIGSRGALLSVSDDTIATLLELSAEETSEIVGMTSVDSKAPDFRQTLHKAKKKIIDLGSYAMKHRERSQVEQMGMK